MSRKSKKRRAAIPNGQRLPPQPQPRRWTAYLNPTRYGLLAVLVGVAAYRFIVLADEPAPPGADPGNWLAFTHGLFGTSVKAAASVYFPVVPVLLKALLTFLPALMALKVVGVGASVLMGIPFYLILRRALSPIFSAGLTLGFHPRWLPGRAAGYWLLPAAPGDDVLSIHRLLADGWPYLGPPAAAPPGRGQHRSGRWHPPLHAGSHGADALGPGGGAVHPGAPGHTPVPPQRRGLGAGRDRLHPSLPSLVHQVPESRGRQSIQREQL